MGDKDINHIKVDAGKLAKPIDTLIKKMASAASVIYMPTHTRRMAKARADAALIKAQSEIAVADLKRRTATRLMLEEMRNQENIESITEQAIPLLEEGADASDVGDDWMANFFSKSKIVSDEEMQTVWAKILAGEVNSPGSFSKRTVNFVADIDYKDAEGFNTLCSFAINDPPSWPVIFNIRDEIYGRNGLTYPLYLHMESIGLIQTDNINGFTLMPPGGLTALFSYFGNRIKFKENVEIPVGTAVLTLIGRELAPLAETKEIAGFFDYLKAQWLSVIEETWTQNTGN